LHRVEEKGTRNFAGALRTSVVDLMAPTKSGQEVMFPAQKTNGLEVRRLTLGELPARGAIAAELARGMSHDLVNLRSWLDGLEERVKALEAMGQEGER
jgi:hypothetical protein